MPTDAQSHSYHATCFIPSLPVLGEFAQALSRNLHPGDLVAMDGTLGAGKTTLVQHLAQALGVRETVSSPTFVLMNEYLSGPFPIVHVDLYRLGPERAGGFAGEIQTVLDEGRALVLVEWACFGEFLRDDITIALQLDFVEPDSESRRITLTSRRPLQFPSHLIEPV
jgi:tRNA threonylcarbamoyladenosine biosynthesis protein TsaE